jgi:zinc protease
VELDLERAAAPLVVAERQLENGLRLLMVPDLRYPLIEARIVFPVGSLDDPPGKLGLAQAAAELLSPDWSRKFTWSEFRAVWRIAKAVPSVEARAGETTTTFRIAGESRDMGELLWWLNWTLESGRYTRTSLERGRAREQRLRRLADRSLTRSTTIREALYGPGHPYSRAMGSLDQLSLRDLRKLRDTHYRARGATLILTGNFDPVRAEAQVRALFGEWSGKAAPPRPRPSTPSLSRSDRAATFLVTDRTELAQLRVGAFFAAPKATAKRAAIRAVLAELLRIRAQGIRERTGASYGFRVSWSSRALADVIQIEGELDPDRAAAILGVLLDDIRSIGDEDSPLLARQFARARNQVLRQLIVARRESRALAAALARSTAGGAGGAGVDTSGQLSQAQSVTLADLQDEARALLDLERAVIVVQGDPSVAREALQRAGLRPVAID